MAKVEKGHFDKDGAYINGLEDGVNMVKRIFELDVKERTERFGNLSVPTILDEFDFMQIKERLENLKKYYVIRGIKVDDNGFKHVRAESDRMTNKPDELLIGIFLNCHKDEHLTFATVEEIYVRE